MTQDISGFGATLNLVADTTFPAGIEISQFADDADAIDVPSVQINDKAMGPNGDMVTWSKANPIMMTINVIPDSDDDRNLQVLAASNRAVRGRRSVRDLITATATWPDGTVDRYLRGKLTDAPLGRSFASSGRQKTKAYIFAFEDKQ